MARGLNERPVPPLRVPHFFDSHMDSIPPGSLSILTELERMSQEPTPNSFPTGGGFDGSGGFGLPGASPAPYYTEEQLRELYKKRAETPPPLPVAGSSPTLDAMRDIPGPPGQVDTSSWPQPQLKDKGIGDYFRDMVGSPNSITDRFGEPPSPLDNMPGMGEDPYEGQRLAPDIPGGTEEPVMEPINLPVSAGPRDPNMDYPPPPMAGIGDIAWGTNKQPTGGLPPLSADQLKAIQDNDGTITPNQHMMPTIGGPDAPPAYDPTTPAYVEPTAAPGEGGATEAPQTKPSTSTRDGGSTGNPATLQTDAANAERSLNFMQKFMKNQLGLEDPDARHNLSVALIKGGAAMATTPGDFSQGLSAGTSAGVDAFVGEEERKFENDRKKELMDLRREEAAAQRAGDALEAEKKRQEIKKLKMEMDRGGKDAGSDSADGKFRDDYYREAAKWGVDLTDPVAKKAFDDDWIRLHKLHTNQSDDDIFGTGTE